MLKTYLQQQQDKLQQMAGRQLQLQGQAEREQQRLGLLSEHIAGLESSRQMQSSLGLQNLAAMKAVLLDMQAQQQQRTESAFGEWQQQQQVCHKQAVYSKGIETVLERRHSARQLQQQRLEQQQSDEMAQQLFQLRRQQTG